MNKKIYSSYKNEQLIFRPNEIIYTIHDGGSNYISR